MNTSLIDTSPADLPDFNLRFEGVDDDVKHADQVLFPALKVFRRHRVAPDQLFHDPAAGK